MWLFCKHLWTGLEIHKPLKEALQTQILQIHHGYLIPGDNFRSFPAPKRKQLPVSISISQPTCWGGRDVEGQEAAALPSHCKAKHTVMRPRTCSSSWFVLLKRQRLYKWARNMRAEICFPEAIWTSQIHFLNSCRIENPSSITSAWRIPAGLPVFLSKQVIQK